MSPRTSLERLERRRLFASVTSNLDVWTIIGSDAGEAITINLRASDQRLRAVVDGEVIATRLLKHVRLIEVLGNGGNDTIKIDLHEPNAKLGVWCNGGPGRDRLFGGALNENLGGGSGRDVIDGGRGDDIVRGGTDRDDVAGGDGNDYVQGNAGNDTLSGGWGDDRITGGTGRDQLRGGDGADQVVGGKDADTIKGGVGNDMLAAGGGVGNVVFREDGADEVLSGATDALEADDADSPLARIETAEALRQWLIERAVAQWKSQFGQPPTYWGWIDGGVLTSSSLDGIVSAVGNAAPTGTETDASETNTQEQGVDEADIVETDGQYLYLLHHDELLIVDARDPADLKIASRTSFEQRPEAMYLDGDRLTVLAQQHGYFSALQPGLVIEDSSVPTTPQKPKVTVTVLNVADRAKPTVVSETSFEGTVSDSRVIDGRLYLVHQNFLNAPAPQIVKNDEGEDVYESEAAYRARLEGGVIDDILPDYTTSGGGGGGAVISPPDVYVRDGQRLDATTITLISLRADEPAPIASTSIIGAGGTVFASADNLYLAGVAWDEQQQGTELFKFGLGIDQVPLVASGTVDGQVLNQFSMDEEGEFFRAATTTNLNGDGQSNAVSVLDQVGDDLTLIGKVEGLGKNERIFSARFIGDRAYVVTFRQIDPLFVIDLSEPTAPQVKGELKIPGFSNYLHPVGEDFLIGVGNDTDEAGTVRSSQVSLFDVSDPSAPTRVDTFDLGQWDFAIGWDHHAISYFPEQAVLALPNGARSATQVLKVDVSSGRFADLGRVQHDEFVSRNVRIGANLFSIGTDAIRVHALADIGDEIDVLALPTSTA